MRTLKDMVAKYVDPQGLNWDSDIKAYTMAYNSSIHTTTGYSPFFMLHGFNPKMPLEAAMSPPDKAVPIRSYLAERLKVISEAYKLVERRTEENAKKTATTYNEKTSGKAYGIGDRVWIRDNQVSVGGKPKLGLYFKGPGTIVRRLGGGSGVTYLVRDGNGREKVLHFNQLKPAFERRAASDEENFEVSPTITPNRAKPTLIPSSSIPTKPAESAKSSVEECEDLQDIEFTRFYLAGKRGQNIANVGNQFDPYVTRYGRVSRPPIRFPQ